ncbi:hypothetical protein [Flectobacillus sp. BAB-3569]|uniref:hypothetical protein n=1 Tax=Flectobacillus sp. BAB-3569 TaxID=1509483 RepID=UPI00113FE2F0|nr:hypothetical protein [Flectobacillus sp. BAB-3569]
MKKISQKELERSERICQFLRDNPIISVSEVERKANMQRTMLQKAVVGKLKNIATKYLSDIEDILKPYGFKVVHSPYTYMQDLKRMLEHHYEIWQAVRDYGEPSEEDLEYLQFVDQLEETIRKSKFYWQPKLKEDASGEFERDPETGDFFLDPEHEKTRPEGV